MKKLLLLLILSSFFILPAHSQKFSIIGTWKQVSYQIMNNGQPMLHRTNDGNGEQLKSWSKETFLFAGKARENSQSSYSFGNGTYSLQGNHYTENIKVHISPFYEGKTLKVYMELKGDTLTQIFPVKDDWSYDINNCNIEKFVKVD